MTPATSVSAYDTLAYPSLPNPGTHPDRLATMAVLAGVAAPPVATCRMLEIGCGDGGNLVPLAYELPGARFVGIDMAAAALGQARATAAELGLTNVELVAGDLATLPRAREPYDYIVAHGLYSWVPAPTRAALLDLIARDLAATGIAFVSYNTLPGCHLRQMLREMARFHVAPIADPTQQVEEAKALLRIVAGARVAPDPVATMLRSEIEPFLARAAGFVFHDDLAPINDPVYFHEFVDRVQAHGLAYLGDAEFGNPGNAALSAEARAVLAGLDPLTREQYLDFFTVRRFRQSLVCRAACAPDLAVTPERLRGLAVRSPKPVLLDSAAASAAMAADARLLQEMIAILAAAAPDALTQDDLCERLRARAPELLASSGCGAGVSRAALAGARAGVLTLHGHRPRIAARAGERPRASAVARQAIARGPVVPTLWHDTVRIDDPTAACLLPLLDGTRDRTAIAAHPASGLPRGPAAAAEALEAHLAQLARFALLED